MEITPGMFAERFNYGVIHGTVRTHRQSEIGSPEGGPWRLTSHILSNYWHKLKYKL